MVVDFQGICFQKIRDAFFFTNGKRMDVVFENYYNIFQGGIFVRFPGEYGGKIMGEM